MATTRNIPAHLVDLADILGPDVDVAILEKLNVISDGNLNRAINHFYEGTYNNVTIPPVRPRAPSQAQAPSATSSARIPSGQKRNSSINNLDEQFFTRRTGASAQSLRQESGTALHSVKQESGTASQAGTGKKRKILDSFFPKYLGEITTIAYALGGMVKIKAGEDVCFERSRPNPQSQLGRKKTGWGGKALKENNVVRFTKENGFEIGRLHVDTARWVSKIMDYGLAEFRGTIILAPPVLQTGAEIVLTMRCYLTAAAFTELGSVSKVLAIPKTGSSFVNEAVETEDELDLKYRKYAMNAMFRELALTPIATNTTVGPRDQNIEIFSSTPEASTTVANEDEEEKEGEPEVSDKELDVLYEKAQQHGREFDPMDPPPTMTYTLKQYQRQALAWMYHKECSKTSESHQTLHPLWEVYEFKQEDGQDLRSSEPRRYYFNPYSSELSLEFPTSDQLCRGGILADEMGLGKTIEILSLVHSNMMDKTELGTPEEAFSRLTTSNSTSTPRRTSPTTLIVCPMSLISQWRDETINSSGGTLTAEVYYGGARDRTEESLLKRGAPDVLITSYGVVMSEYSKLVGARENDQSKAKGISNLDDIKSQNAWRKGSALFNVDFHRVVLDEAHQIKSRLTKTAKACYALNSARRWVVTGTPIQNKLEDLFSLVHFLRAEPWSNFSFWRTFITIPFESKDKDKAMRVITSVLEPLVLRRTKTTKDENGDPIIMLPERTIEIEYLKFSAQENDIYQALFKDGKTKFNHYCRAGTVLRHYASIFQLLMRMRQVCDHPLLVVGRGKTDGAQDLKDGPVQLEELMAKFSGDGDQNDTSFGVSVLENLMKNTDEIPECPVCFEDMADGVLMPCMHAACRSCVLDYLQVRDDKGESGECPICRQGPITENDLIEYTTSDATSAGTKKEDLEDDERSSVSGGNVLISDPSGNSNRVIQMRRNNFKSSAKLDALMRHLNRDRKTDPDAKAVVFSQFTGMLDLAESILDRDGFQFLRLDGTLSQANREQTLRAFKNPDHPATVMLISLRAGGVGLNLTAASRVYMLDPWWNYAIESQAIDRVHRIGQTKPVIVKRFIIEDSVEEKILSIQNRKNALASGLGMTKLEAQGARMDDLQEIFS
ncbi:DNA helicase rad5 [Linnemannia gamsii]|uniref:DNA helicase rad5 n=1 Tax=Linnemannia gamsii TaxID=64522 RepID=A0A9P6QYL4_9FUNG|nr:DNA helicase rad5 [Linnemannia gamsii]